VILKTCWKTYLSHYY